MTVDLSTTSPELVIAYLLQAVRCARRGCTLCKRDATRYLRELAERGLSELAVSAPATANAQAVRDRRTAP